jgi:hypothetical protein
MVSDFPQALVHAGGNEDPEDYDLFLSTKAVMLFGTPHRGLRGDHILEMVKANEFFDRVQLVNSIGIDSEELSSAFTKFKGIASNFDISSFYEVRLSRRLIQVSLR